ncbi:MAG: amidohydrolase family protein [Halobacteriovoraceae bacterium]|nr:amidohydrolase family protein [Halobacteriovoraceae bacterium]
MNKLILGHILNPLSDKKCEFFYGALYLEEGSEKEFKIKKIYNFSSLGIQDLKEEINKINCEVCDFSEYILMPPFFDMHFHWVQDHVRAKPKDSLLEWLTKYTFPAENKFKNRSYAKKEARQFFRKLLAGGTLGGAIYSSIHAHALEYAFKEARGHFVIGDVVMTMNSPAFLSQKIPQARAQIKKFAEKFKERYCFTPRFALATDPETMKFGSKQAKKNQSFIQSHLSENHDEIRSTLSLYREFRGFGHVENYTEIYGKCGVLGAKTLMGHAIHLSESELKLLAKTKTALVHCPTSNAPHREQGLESGLFNFKRVEKFKIPWALGSDIGAGPHLSMFDVMRSFYYQNLRAGKAVSFVKALYHASLAGAEILGVEKKLGNFSKNKEANFLVIKNPYRNLKNKNPEQILKKLIDKYKTQRAQYPLHVKNVFYRGKKVF